MNNNNYPSGYPPNYSPSTQQTQTITQQAPTYSVIPTYSLPVAQPTQITYTQTNPPVYVQTNPPPPYTQTNLPVQTYPPLTYSINTNSPIINNGPYTIQTQPTVTTTYLPNYPTYYYQTTYTTQYPTTYYYPQTTIYTPPPSY